MFNLVKSNAIEVALLKESNRVHVGPVVYKELGSLKQLVDRYITQGRIEQLTGEEISGEEFLNYQVEKNLGPGETESILYAKLLDLIFVCDDRRARSIAKLEIGKDRVTGSIGRLSQAIADGELSKSDAIKSYQRMLDAGAFLPPLKDLHCQ